MTVFILTKQSFPNGMAGTNRIKCYAKAIVSQGIPCKILIYQRTEIHGKQEKINLRKGKIDEIEYFYIGKTTLRSKYSIVRKYYDIKDQINSLFYLFNNLKKDDIVIGYAGVDVKYINCIIRIVHQKKAKFIKELCELPYGPGRQSKEKDKKRAYTLKTQFPMCDGIIAISDTLMELAKKYTNPSCKLTKIPILVDFDQYYLEDHSSEVIVPYIFHSGTLYEQKDGIIGMLEAFGIANSYLSSSLHFISTGSLENSPHKDQIKQIIQKYHIDDKVIFTGYLNTEQLKDYLSKASLVIINKYPNQQNTYCFSTKLGEYLAAGKPVIITKVGEAMNWLKDGENAYIIEPNDTDLLAQTIVNTINNPDRRNKIALNGQKVCKECFDYRNYGKKLLHFFNTINQSNS